MDNSILPVCKSGELVSDSLYSKLYHHTEGYILQPRCLGGYCCTAILKAITSVLKRFLYSLGIVKSTLIYIIRSESEGLYTCKTFILYMSDTADICHRLLHAT